MCPRHGFPPSLRALDWGGIPPGQPPPHPRGRRRVQRDPLLGQPATRRPGGKNSPGSSRAHGPAQRFLKRSTAAGSRFTQHIVIVSTHTYTVCTANTAWHFTKALRLFQHSSHLFPPPSRYVSRPQLFSLFPPPRECPSTSRTPRHGRASSPMPWCAAARAYTIG